MVTFEENRWSLSRRIPVQFQEIMQPLVETLFHFSQDLWLLRASMSTGRRCWITVCLYHSGSAFLLEGSTILFMTYRYDYDLEHLHGQLVSIPKPPFFITYN